MSPNKKSAPDDTIKFETGVMQVNVDPQIIYDQIRANVRRQLPQLNAYSPQTAPIIIVGGGWSLEETFDELRELYFDGVKICALNNAANWLMERNIRPSMHMVMDARPENLYFLEKPIPHCKYFLASQCHPTLFDCVSDRDVTIFHLANGTATPTEDDILTSYYKGRYQRVNPAGTVGVSAIIMCRMLGFQFQHLFGLDSCYASDGRHHAYEQPLNDGEPNKKVWCAGREFTCSYWQAAQAINFQKVIIANRDSIFLSVHGDGLLAHIIKSGAELSVQDDEGGKSDTIRNDVEVGG